AALLVAGLVLYGAGLGLGLVWVEYHIQRMAREREGSFPVPWQTVYAIPLAHIVYFACLASASALRKVSWGEIIYEFEGPWRVRMRRYRPYRLRKTADQGASVV